VGKRMGYTGGEIGWTLEDNDMVNRPIELFGCDCYKKYRVFSKSLGPAKNAVSLDAANALKSRSTN
jgi:hypothetical protein